MLIIMIVSVLLTGFFLVYIFLPLYGTFAIITGDLPGRFHLDASTFHFKAHDSDENLAAIISIQ